MKTTKMTKAELVRLVAAKDQQIARLMDEISRLKAPKSNKGFFIPQEVVHAYYNAHPGLKSVDRNVLRAWAAANNLLPK